MVTAMRRCRDQRVSCVSSLDKAEKINGGTYSCFKQCFGGNGIYCSSVRPQPHRKRNTTWKVRMDEKPSAFILASCKRPRSHQETAARGGVHI